MRQLNLNKMESIEGGKVNCFLWGMFSITTPGVLFNLIDVLDGDSYIGDCWNG